MARRLPWLLLLLAVVGVGWFLHEEGYLGLGAGRDAEEETDALSDDDPGLARDEAAEEAPGAPLLVGSGVAGRGGGRGADADAPGAAAAAAGVKPEVLDPGKVRFGGVVLDAAGRPLEGVAVALTGPGSAQVVTDAEGRFAVEVPPGRYQILLQAERHGALRLANFLVDGGTGLAGEFALEPTANVTVRLQRAGGPVVGARVTLDPGETKTPLAETTGSDGLALFEGVIADRYTVEAVPDPGAGGAPFRITRPLDVKRDETVELEVPAGVRVAGTVTEKDGGPLAGARVEIVTQAQKDTWVTAETVASGDGSYELEVARGEARQIRVQADGYAPWPGPRERRAAFRALGPLRAGQPARLDAALEPGLVLTGRVTQEDGKPVEALQLVLKGRRSPALDATTDRDGRYEARGLAPDRYEAGVVTAGWYPAEPAQVVVAPRPDGGPTVLDVKVRPTLAVWGTVFHAAGSPAAAARVWLEGGGRGMRAARDAGRTFETFTDGSGRWRIEDLPPGEGVTVRASLGALEANPRPLRTSEPPTKGLRLELAPTGSIRGTVVDLDTRERVSGARVVLKPRGAPSGRMAASAATDETGAFEVEDLIPGEWELTPSKRDYLPATAERVLLDAAHLEVDVSLRLDPGLALGGRVQAEGGGAIAGAYVLVDGRAAESGRPVRRSARTAADGTWRLIGFEAGTWRVVVRAPGYRAASFENVAAGNDRMLVALKPRPPAPQ